jgi:hypothetical protein
MGPIAGVTTAIGLAIGHRVPDELVITGGGVGSGTNTLLVWAATMGLSRGIGDDAVITIARMIDCIVLWVIKGH